MTSTIDDLLKVMAEGVERAALHEANSDKRVTSSRPITYSFAQAALHAFVEQIPAFYSDKSTPFWEGLFAWHESTKPKEEI